MKAKILAQLAMLSAAAMLAGSAHADDMKLVGNFGWLGVGKAYTLEQGHIYWVGEFTGTFFNDKGSGSPLDRAGVKCPAWQELNFVTKKGVAAGMCIMNDAAGDQVFLSWKCEGVPGGPCKGTFDVTSGTGKYKGASGSNTFAGVTVSWKDGTATGYSTWNK